jgi:hypothetical protein
MSDPNSARPTPSIADKIKEAALQADTVARSATNLATFGYADKAAAALDALFDRSPGDWLAHYRAGLQNQLNRDYYDAHHRQAATAIGDVLGMGLMTDGAFGFGTGVSAALPIRAKGMVGEGLSAAKTVLKGDWPVGFQVPKRMQNGRNTVLDHETAKGQYVEAKFGPSARLSNNQKYALKQWGPDDYRVDYWMPYHVGAITAPLGTIGGLLSGGMQQPPPVDDDGRQNAPGN